MDFPPFVHGMSSTVITSYADGFTLLALARVQPLPRHRGETGQRIREGTEPEKIFRMQILFRSLPLSFLHLSSSLIFLPSTFFSNCYSFQRSRGIVFTHRRSTRVIADHSCPLPSFTRREKQERERERINEF